MLRRFAGNVGAAIGAMTWSCGVFAATILPQGQTQFLGSNGQPLAGGSVSFFTPGTSSFKATWQNANQTVVNTNPIYLDSAGRAVVYGTGCYTENVNDVNGVLQWTGLTCDTGINNYSWAGQTKGTGNAITLTASNFTFGDGQIIGFLAGTTNTLNTTISPNGGNPTNVVKSTGGGAVSLTGGEIVLGNQYEVVYSAQNGNFQLVSYPTASGVIQQVSTVAALRALPINGLAEGTPVLVGGYYAIGDQGGGTFTYHVGTVTDDGCSNINSNSVGSSFLRQTGTLVTMRQCGAKGDGTVDDTAAYNALIGICNGTNVPASVNISTCLIDKGVFRLTSQPNCLNTSAALIGVQMATSVIFRAFNGVGLKGVVCAGPLASGAKIGDMAVESLAGFSGGSMVSSITGTAAVGAQTFYNLYLTTLGSCTQVFGLYIDGQLANGSPLGFRQIQVTDVQAFGATSASEAFFSVNGLNIVGGGTYPAGCVVGGLAVGYGQVIAGIPGNTSSGVTDSVSTLGSGLNLSQVSSVMVDIPIIGLIPGGGTQSVGTDATATNVLIRSISVSGSVLLNGVNSFYYNPTLSVSGVKVLQGPGGVNCVMNFSAGVLLNFATTC